MYVEVPIWLLVVGGLVFAMCILLLAKPKTANEVEEKILRQNSMMWMRTSTLEKGRTYEVVRGMTGVQDDDDGINALSLILKTSDDPLFRWYLVDCPLLPAKRAELIRKLREKAQVHIRPGDGHVDIV